MTAQSLEETIPRSPFVDFTYPVYHCQKAAVYYSDPIETASATLLFSTFDVRRNSDCTSVCVLLTELLTNLGLFGRFFLGLHLDVICRQFFGFRHHYVSESFLDVERKSCVFPHNHVAGILATLLSSSHERYRPDLEWMWKNIRERVSGIR